MANSYLEAVIRKIDWYITITVTILICCSFVAGRFFYFNGWLNIIIGLMLGLIGGVVLALVEYFIKKQWLYEKGLELEDRIANKLENLKIDYEPHILTQYGDLDLFVDKGGVFYGIEAKNWSGIIKFENGLLKISDWDSTHILVMLLKHCVLVRNIKFGESSGKFIKPVLVFGYKADIHIPNNKIIFNNVEIIIATIKDFEQYFK